jgi:threonine aldolase
LEEKTAAIFGKEAGLFCPSGTMTNQIAIKLHTQPGDEVICDKTSHIYLYEGGGVAFNSGTSLRLINGDRGRITANDVIENINPDNFHFPVTKLVSLENTCNKGGGCYYSLSEIESISKACKENKLILHLDGARIFNALVATGDDPFKLGQNFNTISVCLSKGLGAPVGSVLLGTKEHIKKARRIRKVFGGGMRQAGILAAAGIYALENNIQRLKEDHKRAKNIADTLKDLSFVKDILPVETNIIVYTLKDEVKTADHLKTLSENGIKAVEFGKQMIRMVTHLDFNDDMLEKVLNVLKILSVKEKFSNN